MSFSIRPFNQAAIEAPECLAGFSWPEGFLARPLDIEIGCGVGWHPIQYAKANPDRSLIAIEHTRAKFEKFQSRLSRHPELKNLIAIHADAVRWISHAINDQSVSRYFLLYPNPEPKAASKRWMRMPFMEKLLATLKPSGELTLATNEQVYFNEALDFAVKAWKLNILEVRTLTKASAQISFRTHFEKKYLLSGQTCYDVTFQKP